MGDACGWPRRSGGRRRSCASGAGALIAVEGRDGLGFGQVVCRRLVEAEAEVGLRRSAAGDRGGGVVGRPRWVRMAS